MDVYDWFSYLLLWFDWDMHANRTNNRIHNKLHYIATIMLSNIAMKAFEPAGIPKRRAAGVEEHNPGLL